MDFTANGTNNLKRKNQEDSEKSIKRKKYERNNREGIIMLGAPFLIAKIQITTQEGCALDPLVEEAVLKQITGIKIHGSSFINSYDFS